MTGISTLLRELRRRKVFGVVALYIVGAWVVLQVAGLALESWGLPANALQYIWIGALIGFPVAIIFGWTYDLTNSGIVRTPAAQSGDKADTSLGRGDYLFLGSIVMILGIIAYAVLNRVQLDLRSDADEQVGVSVTTWPEADVLFRQDPRWLGGDTSASIDLGGGRVLWLFGDSFIASASDRGRAGSTIVNNCVAIQHGYDPSSATVQFFWRTDGPRPTSFFSDNEDSWYWPSSAILVGQSLLVFLVETKAIDHGLGFEHVGAAAILVDNPKDDPDSWLLKELAVPPNELGAFVGFSETIRFEDHVYGFSKQESTHDVYVIRWSLEQLAAGCLECSEWWSGDTDRWLQAEDSSGRVHPVFSDTATPFSIHYEPKLGRFVQLQTWGFGHAVVAMRTADTLTGPWSDRQIIYRPGESRRSDAMIYGGKGHSHLSGADIVATFNVSSEIFSNLVADQSIYYPKFIRIDIEP